MIFSLEFSFVFLGGGFIWLRFGFLFFVTNSSVFILLGLFGELMVLFGLFLVYGKCSIKVSDRECW